ncbi:MAG TPA: MBL fold metallo-hydrolase [Ilumatobacteraceae bacterium]|nr:MBL fold metallo-hydrolase [Ilumatobacteraceae bacterium]
MTDAAANDRFYFRQLLSGRDFAVGDPIASQMVNFAYAIGDRGTGECVLVDPAYAVNDLVDLVEADGMRVVGALATHYHADHIGGNMMGYEIEGIEALLARCDCPIHVQADEAEWIRKTTSLTSDQMTMHRSGDVVSVGEVKITLVHTPGHTPGSQCFHVDQRGAGGRLVSGDTLFLDGCGRTDLPGSDPAKMYESLQTLRSMPTDTIVFPGHRYSTPSSATMESIVESNYVFRPSNASQWLQIFGR